jgi:twitching motility protein PilT
MIDTKQMLAQAIENGASDVHINANMPPIMRINTELIMMDLPEVSNDDAGKMILEMIGEDKFKKFLEKRDADFSTMIEDGSRFRVNAHFQKESFALSFRAISNHIPDMDDLHLPDVAKELTDLPRGLVVVTGHTGSGKSTSLASMVNVINQKYRKRIITLEDPIEYLMENKSCMIEQREMGADCTSFASGLRHALRQDPDIILVGEMRDLETTSSTITAAETGHLVFSTLHTVNASQTVERIIDIYPASQQNQIRAMLANTLQAVISQTLFRRVDQPGMVPCCEILLQLCETASVKTAFMKSPTSSKHPGGWVCRVWTTASSKTL